MSKVKAPMKRSLSKRLWVVRGRTARGESTSFMNFCAKHTSPTAKIDAIRAGIPAGIVTGMVAYLDVSKGEVFEILHTAPSTAHRLIKQKGSLGAAASERVVRVADVARMAEETFGGRDNAARWLKTPNLALGNQTPLSMLDTEPGANEVRRVLSAIDYGGAL